MKPRREVALQWNMGFRQKKLSAAVQQSRLGVLEAMLKEHAPGIVALQEAPEDVRDRCKALGRMYDAIEGPRSIVTAFRKERWQVIDRFFGSRQRSLVVKADSSEGRLHLSVWNLHLPVLWKDIGSRRTLVQCDLREELFRARGADPDRRELLFGDFNLPPYDDALVRRSGFYANRALPEVSPRESLYRPLLNATWSLLGRVAPPYGSYYHAKDKDGEGPWLLPDQVLLSPDLAIAGMPQVSIVDRVVAHETTTRLHTKDFRPDANVGSDHFPLRIEFQLA